MEEPDLLDTFDYIHLQNIKWKKKNQQSQK